MRVENTPILSSRGIEGLSCDRYRGGSLTPFGMTGLGLRHVPCHPERVPVIVLHMFAKQLWDIIHRMISILDDIIMKK